MEQMYSSFTVDKNIGHRIPSEEYSSYECL